MKLLLHVLIAVNLDVVFEPTRSRRQENGLSFHYRHVALFAQLIYINDVASLEKATQMGRQSFDTRILLEGPRPKQTIQSQLWRCVSSYGATLTSFPRRSC